MDDGLIGLGIERLGRHRADLDAAHLDVGADAEPVDTVELRHQRIAAHGPRIGMIVGESEEDGGYQQNDSTNQRLDEIS